jgi:hypothetical protein
MKKGKKLKLPSYGMKDPLKMKNKKDFYNDKSGSLKKLMK